MSELKVLNGTKLILNAHSAPIWYHSEPSDVPYSPNQFFALDFFGRFLQQGSSNLHDIWYDSAVRLLYVVHARARSRF